MVKIQTSTFNYKNDYYDYSLHRDRIEGQLTEMDMLLIYFKAQYFKNF